MTTLRKFAGFVPPEKNYFHMPNEWIDICAEIDNLAEIKVIQYVLRHTWGYQEYGIAKAITVDEFMYGRKRTDGTRMDKGTGLKSDRSVKDGIKDAIEHGYLICEIDATDKARIKKSYAVKMLPEQLREGYNLPPDTRQVVSTPQTGSIYPSEVQNLPLRDIVSTPRSEKDTIERHYKKDTEERQEREVATATARSQTSSQNDLSEDTEKREAVKASQKEATDGDNHFYIGGNSRDASGHAPTTLQDSPRDTLRATPSQSTKDTNKVTEPPAPRKPPSNPVPRRPKQQGIVLMDEIPGDAIPEKAIAIMDRWDRVHKKPAPRTIKTIQAAQLLMVYDPSEDELRDCEKWLYTTDRPGKPWYRSHGVHLPDIAEKIGSWQSLQNAPPTKPEKEPSNEHKASNFYSADALFERNKWKTEAFLAEYEAKSAAKQEVQS